MALRKKVGAVMVVGAGIGGMRAAADLAESGMRVYLVEALPAIGGIVSQLGFMFPTHDCVLCRGTGEHGYGCTRPSITPKLLDHDLHPNIQVMTTTQIVAVSGEPGSFQVRVRHEPRYVDVRRCINCDACAQVCPVELPSTYQAGLATRKAAYKVAPRSVPDAYVIDRGDYCDPCLKCQEVCPTHAIDLSQQPWEEDLEVGAIILSVGYRLYDPTAAQEYGYGRFPNVLTSMQYERLASRSGPTEGIPLRPSDGKLPQKIAWLQCIGSRDQIHPYCSSICCMYTTKEAVLAKQRLPGVEAKVFMMDERAFSKEYNAYYEQARTLWGIQYIRCRVSEIKEDPRTRDLYVGYHDDEGRLRYEKFNMVVLAVGSEPPPAAVALADQLGIDLNQYGFCNTDKFAPLETSRPGIYVAGAFSSPKEIAETVIDASGAVAESLKLLSGTRGTLSRERLIPPERDISGEPVRVGVFVCRCGTVVADVVDTAAVAQFASRLPDVVHSQEVEFACLPEGIEEIKAAIRTHGLNRVVVAACTPRTHQALFRRVLQEEGLNPYLLEFVSIREHGAWVHADDPAGATRQAREMVRVAAARARLLQPVRKERRPVKHQTVVLGGGIAGMTAALTLADWGYDVYLVEREAQLGGNVRHIYFTAEGPDPQRFLKNLIRDVECHENIAVLKNSELVRFEGRVGDFRSTVRTRHPDGTFSERTIEHGVIIVATGAQEYRGPVYLFGQDPRVITQMDLERRIATAPEEIAALKEVVMIQCVQPPDAPIEYCSRTCCTNTMKNALRIKEINPDCKITVLYKDLITYGFREEYYTEARRRGVLFVRYEEGQRPTVQVVDGRLQVRARDPVLGNTLVWEPDLLALSMASVPDESNARLARLLGVPLSREGFFLEDHLKLRPVDFSIDGIFLCGSAHYPKFIEEAISHAKAAAGRAMTVLTKDEREVGGVVAVVDQTKCVGCLTCVRTCPFHIPRIQPRATGVGGILGAAYIEPANCTGCGTCTAECPADAIQLTTFHDRQVVIEDAAVLGQWCPG
ncbi:MAG: FAD-dependent oxidoreductase [Anaerolineae bacterium]